MRILLWRQPLCLAQAPPQGGIDAVLQAMEKKRKLSVLDKTKMARGFCLRTPVGGGCLGASRTHSLCSHSLQDWDGVKKTDTEVRRRCLPLAFSEPPCERPLARAEPSCVLPQVLEDVEMHKKSGATYLEQQNFLKARPTERTTRGRPPQQARMRLRGASPGALSRAARPPPAQTPRRRHRTSSSGSTSVSGMRGWPRTRGTAAACDAGSVWGVMRATRRPGGFGGLGHHHHGTTPPTRRAEAGAAGAAPPRHDTAGVRWCLAAPEDAAEPVVCRALLSCSCCGAKLTWSREETARNRHDTAS